VAVDEWRVGASSGKLLAATLSTELAVAVVKIGTRIGQVAVAPVSPFMSVVIVPVPKASPPRQRRIAVPTA
jgi:hypothetical protein